MPLDPTLHTVLIIGSGPIVIGQACEFDYSGSQAAMSLREEGIQVVLINSNPATIMTDSHMADHIYLCPLEKAQIEKILMRHKIDAVLPTMGGQTALNLAMEGEEAGLWKKYGVRQIGVHTDVIRKTEDRSLFRTCMQDLGLPVCHGHAATSFLQGKEIAQKMGFPLIIRSSYTLGGEGGGLVEREEDFEEALHTGLHASPIHEVLLEESVQGWKEYELELLADTKGNLVIICSIENVDPMGIHTGDSITVAPALTLPDTVYQRMRDMAMRAMHGLGHFAGGCNIQFAVCPEREHLRVIEVNPRVSRSSALASKATGYPIARIATKLAIGYTLDELPNQITRKTSAFFEPALDYVVVKIPRWNFDKFEGASRTLGLQMKSVGEVMAIGRTFQEALQKALCSLEIRMEHLLFEDKGHLNEKTILEYLQKPRWDRLFHIFHAFKLGVSASTVQKLTRIDAWFLHHMESLVHREQALMAYDVHNVSVSVLREAKEAGFSDIHLSILLRCREKEVYTRRVKEKITRTYKMVDTCAAEFAAETPYYYSTFAHENESKPSRRKKVLVLGSGPNRIGQGIEFDYSCVHGLWGAKDCGYETIMINCNPETVSTDFNIADKLYFEPVDMEYVRDLVLLERPEGVIIQLGGQTALKLAAPLQAEGIPIIGTSVASLDRAEDRGSFSDFLKAQGIPYPDYGVIRGTEDALALARTLGFPLLVRPSYVLGGQSMKIVLNTEELEAHIVRLFKRMPENRIMLDHFLDGAIEAEVDAIADGDAVHILGMMQHIEPAGIHSGDSYAVLPPYDLSTQTMQDMEAYTHRIAKGLDICGLINIQFAIRQGKVYVIEANPRASRTVPFICKAHQKPYVRMATQIMLGHKRLKDFDLQHHMKGYAIKQPVFSFHKFADISKELGPEMKSTGENIYFIENLEDDYFRRIYAERNIFLSK